MIPEAERIKRRANHEREQAASLRTPARKHVKHSFCGQHIPGAACGFGHARGWLSAGRHDTRAGVLDWLTKRKAREQHKASVTRDATVTPFSMGQHIIESKPRPWQTVAGWLRRQARALQRHVHTAMGRLKGRR